MARPRKSVVKDQNALLTPDNVVEIPVEEQPYPLPEGWKWVRLSSFADCLDKFRKPINADERAVREGTIPYYGATGQVGWIDDYLTNEHLVLVGEDGAPFFDILKNKSYIIEGKSWVNNHAHILRSFSGKNGNIYLMHYLNIFNYSGYVNGTTRFLFPFPPSTSNNALLTVSKRFLQNWTRPEKRPRPYLMALKAARPPFCTRRSRGS